MLVLIKFRILTLLSSENFNLYISVNENCKINICNVLRYPSSITMFYDLKHLFYVLFCISPIQLNISILAPLQHLVVISVERYMVMKFALRYEEIVTKLQLPIAVAVSWFVSGLVTLLNNLGVDPLSFSVICCLLAIVYCHNAVYLITRRHLKTNRNWTIFMRSRCKVHEGKESHRTGFLFLKFTPGVIFYLGRCRLHCQTRYVPRLFIDASVNFTCLSLKVDNPQYYDTETHL